MSFVDEKRMFKDKRNLERAIDQMCHTENGILPALTVKKCYSSVDILYSKIKAKCAADPCFKAEYLARKAYVDDYDLDFSQGASNSEYAHNSYSLGDMNYFLRNFLDLFNNKFRAKEVARIERLRSQKEKREQKEAERERKNPAISVLISCAPTGSNKPATSSMQILGVTAQFNYDLSALDYTQLMKIKEFATQAIEGLLKAGLVRENRVVNFV